LWPALNTPLAVEKGATAASTLVVICVFSTVLFLSDLAAVLNYHFQPAPTTATRATKDVADPTTRPNKRERDISTSPLQSGAAACPRPPT
jgi:hypothetical protein